MKNLYMAVTPDEYELPIAVAGSVTELSNMIGKKRDLISCAICKKLNGNASGMKFIRIEVEE